MTKQEQERARDNARFMEFFYLYQTLTPWGKVQVNTSMAWMLAQTAIERQNMRLLAQAIRLFIHSWAEFLRPYLPAIILTLGAVLAWAWALATGAGGLFVAALAICAAAALKAWPLLQLAGGDDIE